MSASITCKTLDPKSFASHVRGTASVKDCPISVATTTVSNGKHEPEIVATVTMRPKSCLYSDNARDYHAHPDASFLHNWRTAIRLGLSADAMGSDVLSVDDLATKIKQAFLTEVYCAQEDVLPALDLGPEVHDRLPSIRFEREHGSYRIKVPVQTAAGSDSSGFHLVFKVNPSDCSISGSAKACQGEEKD